MTATERQSGETMHDENGPDPVTREIVQNYLASAADTMAVTVVRTARAAVVKDGMDFSTGIFNAEGQQVAQGLAGVFHVREGIDHWYGGIGGQLLQRLVAVGACHHNVNVP